jgi:hypothetical protein
MTGCYEVLSEFSKFGYAHFALQGRVDSTRLLFLCNEGKIFWR